MRRRVRTIERRELLRPLNDAFQWVCLNPANVGEVLSNISCTTQTSTFVKSPRLTAFKVFWRILHVICSDTLDCGDDESRLLLRHTEHRIGVIPKVRLIPKSAPPMGAFGWPSHGGLA